jgi:amino acid permease
MTAVMACIIPKFGLFLNFVGSFAGTVICILIPVVIYEKVFRGQISTPRRLLNLFIFLVGIIFGGISTVASFVVLVYSLGK